jgi:hypothetical protein
MNMHKWADKAWLSSSSGDGKIEVVVEKEGVEVRIKGG